MQVRTIRKGIRQSDAIWQSRQALDLGARETIKDAPECLECDAIAREHETGLYSYYDYDGYWVEELIPA